MNVQGTSVTLESSMRSPTLSMSRADFRALCEQILPLVTAQVFEKRDRPVYSAVPANIREGFLDRRGRTSCASS